MLGRRQLVPGGDLPEANAAGPVARGQEGAIGAEGDRFHLAAKAGELLNEPAAGRVPDPDSTVFAGGRQMAAVPSEGKTGSSADVGPDDELLAGRGQVPDPNHAVVALASDKELAILAEVDDPDTRLFQDGGLPVRRELPQANGPILQIHERDHLFVRAEADRSGKPEAPKVSRWNSGTPSTAPPESSA